MRDVRDAYEEFQAPGDTSLDWRMFSAQQHDPRLEFPGEDWILLFSLDSEGDGGYGVGWGAGGVGNFYIRTEHLIQRDFSKVMYYWDFVDSASCDATARYTTRRRVLGRKQPTPNDC